jgi:hypothetical protein
MHSGIFAMLSEHTSSQMILNAFTPLLASSRESRAFCEEF